MYDPPPGDLTGPQDAIVNYINLLTTLPPFTNASRAFEQDGYSGSIAIIRTTPANEGSGSRTNLLTAQFIDAILSGVPGSSDLDLTVANGNLALSSDFITDFGDKISRTMDFTFHLSSPLVSANDLAEFTASSFDGVFTVEPGPVQFVPEPSTFGLFGLGLAGVLCVYCWKRWVVG
jgi:hypothetical protein